MNKIKAHVSIIASAVETLAFILVNVTNLSIVSDHFFIENHKEFEYLRSNFA